MKIANGITDKTFGLILNKNLSLLIQTRWGIHTFGLKKPIWAGVLDSNQIVVKATIVKPNRILFWNPKYNTILELTSHIHTSIEVGDKLKIS